MPFSLFLSLCSDKPDKLGFYIIGITILFRYKCHGCGLQIFYRHDPDTDITFIFKVEIFIIHEA